MCVCMLASVSALNVTVQNLCAYLHCLTHTPYARCIKVRQKTNKNKLKEKSFAYNNIYERAPERPRKKKKRTQREQKESHNFKSH